MAANHVPSDQVPQAMPGQNIYADPAYPSLFSSVDRYGNPSWEAPLHHHAALAPSPSPQSWHHSSFSQQPFNALSPAYGSHASSLRTASPYQYGQFSQQASVSAYDPASNVDPALAVDASTIGQPQQSPYSMPMRNVAPQSTPATVTPQALQQSVSSLQNGRPAVSTFQMPRTTTEGMAPQRAFPPSTVKLVRMPDYELPRGRKSGGLCVLDQSALVKATNSTPLNKLVTLGSEPFHLATNRTALPLYTARLSFREARKAGAVNQKLVKLSSLKLSTSKSLISERQSVRAAAGVKREVGDSDSSTESSDEYSDSSDDEVEESSPLPTSRSEEPHEAVRYDTIKATWYPHSASLSSEKIKNSMRDIWEVLNTIQKRWRTDSRAVTEAEEQKKAGELPVLKSRVTSQRDLLQSALKAALEFAHPDVLYHLGQVKPFLYLCDQFLANRFHSKDYDGTLSAVIFETLSRCGTLTSELLEETKVIKALVSMKKHANEKHKTFIQKVIDGAAVNSKKEKAKYSPPPRTDSAEAKGARRSATDAARAPADSPVAKEAKSVDVGVHASRKDSSVASGPKFTTASGALTQKRPGEKTATGSAPTKARINQVSSKPSGLFASLNAASKKPLPPPAPVSANIKTHAAAKASAAVTKDKKAATVTAQKPAFSFAQTMASLLKPKEQEAAPAKSEKQAPVESREEKAKRLRKESRRHLRVTFRPEASLTEIRYFNHVPEEDTGHEENLVRDAGDIGGEGRMFKQHKELDVDDDDDDDREHLRFGSTPWKEPSQVDFSMIKLEERQRNYMPFGGGQKLPSTPEKEANVRRENATLMVFYTHPSDIPAFPREPPDELHALVEATAFGAPTDLCLQRCPQPPPQPSSAPAPAPTTAPDFSGLESIFKQFATPAANPPLAVTQSTTPSLPTATADLATILSTLNGHGATQPPAAPALTSMQAPVQQAPPPVPTGLDFNTLMVMMQAQAASGAPLPPPPPGPPPAFSSYGFPYSAQTQPADTAAYQVPTLDGGGFATQANAGSKRPRDDGNTNTAGQGKRHKNRGERPHKVLACKFYQKGTCNKGDHCTYIHDLNS